MNLSNTRPFEVSAMTNMFRRTDEIQDQMYNAQRRVSNAGPDSTTVLKFDTVADMERSDIMQMNELMIKSLSIAKYNESAGHLKQKFSTGLEITQGIFENVNNIIIDLSMPLTTNRNQIKNSVTASLDFIKSQFTVPFINESLFSSNDPTSAIGDQSKTVKIAPEITIKSDISSKNPAFTAIITALEEIQKQVNDPSVTDITAEAKNALDTAISGPLTAYIGTLSALHKKTADAIDSNDKVLANNSQELKYITTKDLVQESQKIIDYRSNLQTIHALMQMRLNEPSLGKMIMQQS